MPYIPQENRKKHKFLLQMLNSAIIDNPADLSFLITRIMRRYIIGHDHPFCWDTYSDILKALDAAREAFMEDVYRPHERGKKKENGGVF